MIRSIKSTVLSAALLAAIAGSAYAAGEPSNYSSPTMGPKASTGTHTQTTHWQKPAGYDQDPAMHPYTRDGVLKAN